MNHLFRSMHFQAACLLAAGFLVSSAACGRNSGAGLGSGGTPGPGGTGVATGGASGSGGGDGTTGSGGRTSSGSGGATAPGGNGNGGATVNPTGSGGGGAGVAGVTGVRGTGGAGGAGSPGSTPFPAACVTPAVTGSATRPLLTDASAECFTIKKYLAQAGPIGAVVTDNWDPSAGLPAAATLTPTFTVAADGSGTHTTVQAAVTAAKATGGTARAYILVTPGTYRELVCVDGNVPMTIYGAGDDPTRVTIAFDNYNGKTVDPLRTNACNIPTTATYGTSGSSTFFVKSAGFQAMNLTIANDFDEGALTANIQAVALTTQGDQDVFQNVRVLGNQDTLQVKSASVATIARVYFKDSTIAGDTDFIFGRAAAVFDGCTINYVAGRKTNSTYIAPSTETLHPYGFLIIDSMLTADPGITGTTYLGRAWDDSSGTMPNGQGVIRNSQIGAQIVVAAPWAPAATSNRAFSASGNRLYEYQNTGPGAAPP